MKHKISNILVKFANYILINNADGLGYQFIDNNKYYSKTYLESYKNTTQIKTILNKTDYRCVKNGDIENIIKSIKNNS